MKPRVLIVDDDAAITQQLFWTLCEEYDVMTANDLASAVRRATIYEPAVSILDLHLPPAPDSPEVGLRITRLLSERLRRYEIRLEDLSVKGITARLASLILLLLESEGVVSSRNYLKIPTHYTHQHLGTMIGTNREAVTKAFTRLQDEGLVELRRRLIYIPNAEALRRRAEEHHGANRQEEG